LGRFADNIFKLSIVGSLLLGSSSVAYYYLIYVPRRDVLLDAERQAEKERAEADKHAERERGDREKRAEEERLAAEKAKADTEKRAERERELEKERVFEQHKTAEKAAAGIAPAAVELGKEALPTVSR
jgi:hypothetical protein